jgi:hypothetical protein
VVRSEASDGLRSYIAGRWFSVTKRSDILSEANALSRSLARREIGGNGFQLPCRFRPISHEHGPFCSVSMIVFTPVLLDLSHGLSFNPKSILALLRARV